MNLKNAMAAALTWKSLACASIIAAATALPPYSTSAAAHETMGEMQQMMREHPDFRREMKRNPHHLLAMAYRRNIMAFAGALEIAAHQGETIPPDFARKAVDEMKRSQKLLEKEHGEFLRTIPENVKKTLDDMPKMMDKHLAAMRTDLDRLDEDVKKDPVDSKQVLQDLQPVYKGCIGMNGPGMREGKWTQGCSRMELHHKKMAKLMKDQDAQLAEETAKMNSAPEDKKIPIMADIITRMVKQRAEMNAQMEEAHGDMMHHMMRHEGMHERSCCCPPDTGGQEMAPQEEEESDSTGAEEET